MTDAKRRLRQHPSAIMFRELQSLRQTISGVFQRNWLELRQLLDAAAANPQLAMELVQNVRKPDVRDEFQASVTQRLHNYVAGTMTLVDHVRRLRRDSTDAIGREFDARLSEFNSHGINHFVKDLRNFILHRSLPVLGHTVSLPAGTSFTGMIREVQLSTEELKGWDGWTAPARSYLEAQGDSLSLRPLIREHGERVVRLNSWFHDEMAASIASGVQEMNEIIAEYNAAMTGGTLEQGREMSRRWTDMQSDSGPMGVEDLAERLQNEDDQ